MCRNCLTSKFACRNSLLHKSLVMVVQAIFLVVDLQDEDFAQPMLGVYGLDTKRPSVSDSFSDLSSIWNDSLDLVFVRLGRMTVPSREICGLTDLVAKSV